MAEPYFARIGAPAYHDGGAAGPGAAFSDMKPGVDMSKNVGERCAHPRWGPSVVHPSFERRRPASRPIKPTGRQGTPRAVASAASRTLLAGTELGGGKGSAVAALEGPAMVAARRVSPGAPGRRSRRSSAIPPQMSNTSIMTVPKKAPVS